MSCCYLQLSCARMEQKEMREFLKQGWEEVLQVKDVNDNSDFFADGGNSIKAVQLPSWLVQKGIKLDIMDIFKTPTFGELVLTLKETNPLYMPEEMITKEVAAREMGFASVEEGEKAERSGNFIPKDKQVCTSAEQKDNQVCTPAEQNDGQVCTPAEQKDGQVCTPAQASGQICTPSQATGQYFVPVQVFIPIQFAWQAFAPTGQICTPVQSNGQICTPVQSNGQICTPVQSNGQICTPVQSNGQICTPGANQGYSSANAENMPEQLKKYFPKQIEKPVENPNVVKISKAKIAEKTKSQSDVLMDVMTGILPTFDRNRDFFEQGITSLDTVKIVTRCAEAGYEVELKDIYMHSTFDELLGYMK